MDRNRLALCMLAAVLATATLFASSLPGQEDEIKAAFAEETAAFMRGDADELTEIFAEDFVVTNPFGDLLTGKEVVERVRRREIAFSAYHREFDHIRFYGDIAVVAGRETFTPAGKMPGAGKPMHIRFTSVWQKQEGRWRKLARHTSLLRTSNQQQP